DVRVWTSAGVTSGIDLALSLIQQDTGRKVAIEVARMLVVYLKRAGGQSQYSALLAAQAQSDSDRFSEMEQWIAENLKKRPARRSIGGTGTHEPQELREALRQDAGPHSRENGRGHSHRCGAPPTGGDARQDNDDCRSLWLR